jgi:hypothetical protein
VTVTRWMPNLWAKLLDRHLLSVSRDQLIDLGGTEPAGGLSQAGTVSGPLPGHSLDTQLHGALRPIGAVVRGTWGAHGSPLL